MKRDININIHEQALEVTHRATSQWNSQKLFGFQNLYLFRVEYLLVKFYLGKYSGAILRDTNSRGLERRKPPPATEPWNGRSESKINIKPPRWTFVFATW